VTERPGLQAERTLLAWSRTVLLLGVDGLLILRTGLVHDGPGLVVLGALLTAVAVGFHAHGLRRMRRLEQRGPEAAGPAPLRLLTLAVAVAAAGSAWSVLVRAAGQ
jgi:uncharacterized membrane protein YidH (DUF202 family)